MAARWAAGGGGGWRRGRIHGGSEQEPADSAPGYQGRHDGYEWAADERHGHERRSRSECLSGGVEETRTKVLRVEGLTGVNGLRL